MSSIYQDMTNAEKEVAGFLRKLDLWWRFESPVFVYDEKDRPRVWTPDFYIPKLGMYIEVCGAERESDYSYRKRIFKKNRYHVIFVQTYKERNRWKNYLIEKILEIEEERHTEVMKLIKSLKFIE